MSGLASLLFSLCGCCQSIFILGERTSVTLRSSEWLLAFRKTALYVIPFQPRINPHRTSLHSPRGSIGEFSILHGDLSRSDLLMHAKRDGMERESNENRAGCIVSRRRVNPIFPVPSTCASTLLHFPLPLPLSFTRFFFSLSLFLSTCSSSRF